MKRIAALLAGLGSLAVLAAPLAAQTVRGRVVDARTGEGVPQAAVTALAASGNRRTGQARTDASGRFSLTMRAPGEVRLRVERTGYRETLTDPTPVGPRDTVEVELSVSAAPLTIAPLRVTARVEPPHRRNLELNGFYERERKGIGRFVRREEIERHGDFTLAQSLSRIPGAVVQYVRVHQYIYFPRSGCRPWVFLDGTRIIIDSSQDINSIVSPNQVEAMEVFIGPSEVPAEYAAGRGACGVVLIWTKHEA
jgi:hypothetical protein